MLAIGSSPVCEEAAATGRGHMEMFWYTASGEVSNHSANYQTCQWGSLDEIFSTSLSLMQPHEQAEQRLLSSVQCSSVPQSCLTLCDPMNLSTPGPPVHHQLPESTQTHVHRVGDAIQPSHPLSSPSPLAPNPSQH